VPVTRIRWLLGVIIYHMILHLIMTHILAISVLLAILYTGKSDQRVPYNEEQHSVRAIIAISMSANPASVVKRVNGQRSE